MTPKPAFVRVEYWNEMIQGWHVGHAGLMLNDPALYVKKLAERGVIARAVDKETGEVMYGPGGDLL